MAYAVSLFFDAETNRTVRDLWRAVDEAQLSSFLHKGPFHPHLTLAIYEYMDTVECSHALEAYAGKQQSLPLFFSSIGVFPGTEGVVFLSATMTTSLLSLHRQIYALLSEYARNPVFYYLPDSWNPHCSVARGLTVNQIPATVAVCQQNLSDTITGRITGIGIVETPAEIEICRYLLREQHEL